MCATFASLLQAYCTAGRWRETEPVLQVGRAAGAAPRARHTGHWQSIYPWPLGAPRLTAEQGCEQGALHLRCPRRRCGTGGCRPLSTSTAPSFGATATTTARVRPAGGRLREPPCSGKPPVCMPAGAEGAVVQRQAACMHAGLPTTCCGWVAEPLTEPDRPLGCPPSAPSAPAPHTVCPAPPAMPLNPLPPTHPPMLRRPMQTARRRCLTRCWPRGWSRACPPGPRCSTRMQSPSRCGAHAALARIGMAPGVAPPERICAAYVRACHRTR